MYSESTFPNKKPISKNKIKKKVFPKFQQFFSTYSYVGHFNEMKCVFFRIINMFNCVH